MTTSKIASMHDAIAGLVRDGDAVAIEGFTHLICFAAGHEIIRQRKRDLTLCRLTPDVIYDQMIAAGVARKLVFSWLGNPGVGGLGAIRRRVEGAIPEQPLELEEYSHFGMVARYTDSDLSLVEMYRLAHTVLEVDPGRVSVCVVTGSTGMAGGASVVFPNVGQARALARDVRHDARVDHGC